MPSHIHAENRLRARVHTHIRTHKRWANNRTKREDERMVDRISRRVSLSINCLSKNILAMPENVRRNEKWAVRAAILFFLLSFQPPLWIRVFNAISIIQFYYLLYTFLRFKWEQSAVCSSISATQPFSVCRQSTKKEREYKLEASTLFFLISLVSFVTAESN